ncbi:hypothetical protein NPS46_24600, partial [Pseudomonas putida]|uniref:hypothetical protein n=1 Tax=Pseudomonas putida TaxID=303 RepID=UPI002363DDFE
IVKIKFRNPNCESNWGFVYAREKERKSMSRSMSRARHARSLAMVRFALDFVPSQAGFMVVHGNRLDELRSLGRR